MQADTNGSHSVTTPLTSLNYPPDSFDTQTRNHFVSRFSVPLALGESMHGFDNRVTVANPSDFFSIQQGIRDVRNFPSNTFSTNLQETDRFLAQQDYHPFGHPFVMSSSMNVEEMHHGYNEGLPYETSPRWDPSKFVTRNGAQNHVRTNEWPEGSTRFNNRLSLSLATSHPPNHDQCSDLSSLVSEHTSCSSRNVSMSFDSYEQVHIPGSRFVGAVQEILAEIARYALKNAEQMSFRPGLDSYCVDRTIVSPNGFAQEREDVAARKKHLLDLLQMVDDRYNQCMDEIHTVTSAFHAVTELDPDLHARFVLPTISFMYKNLRERTSSHILALGSVNHNEGEQRDEKSFETCFIQRQWALQQLNKRDHQLWRPQRGLPEKSVSVLRAWMFQNFLHPYPKDAEKHLLALKSGLTRNQVSNWFINARVRLWKPMIEEMYAEMNRRKARRKEEENDHGNHRNNNLLCFENRRLTME
ncbi:hypothetical protein OROGR_014603 [Orobanche gracilis]